MKSKPLKDRPELTAALKRSRETWALMSPEDRQAMLVAQRRSWVIGEMMLENPEMTREDAVAIYNRAMLGNQ